MGWWIFGKSDRKPKYKRNQIVELVEDYKDDYYRHPFTKGERARVLAVSGDKLSVLFDYNSSCPFSRKQVTLTAELVKRA